MSSLLATVALAAALAAPTKPTVPPPSPEEIVALSRENALLTKLADLAKGKEFYLLLDPRQGTLSLNLKGATLQTWKVVGIEVGGPRVAFVSRGVPDDWEGRIWPRGNLDPERKIDRYEVVAPPPTKEGTEVEIPIPPTPEEKYPVPPRYHVRYDGGLSIEVIPPGSKDERGFWSRLRSRLALWWHDFGEALSTSPTDRVRIRLVLSAKDADSLYRALPPDTKLLVLPPTD